MICYAQDLSAESGAGAYLARYSSARPHLDVLLCLEPA